MIPISLVACTRSPTVAVVAVATGVTAASGATAVAAAAAAAMMAGVTLAPAAATADAVAAVHPLAVLLLLPRLIRYQLLLHSLLLLLPFIRLLLLFLLLQLIRYQLLWRRLCQCLQLLLLSPPFLLQYTLLLFLLLSQLLHLMLHLVPDRLQNFFKLLLLCVYPLTLLQVELVRDLIHCPSKSVIWRRNSVAPLGVRSFYECSMISRVVTQGNHGIFWTWDAATCAAANVLTLLCNPRIRDSQLVLIREMTRKGICHPLHSEPKLEVV